MSFIDFSKNEFVNVGIIDSQHDNIAHIINEIHDSIESGNSTTLNDHLKKLVEEIEIHFETEEVLMKGNKFPGYFSHKLEHDRFYKQLLQNIEKYKKDFSAIDFEIINGLRKWFFNHIEINDKKCGEFLNSIGIK